MLETLGYRLELGDGSLALIAAEQVRPEVAGVIRVQDAQHPPGDLGVVEGVLDVIGHVNLARPERARPVSGGTCGLSAMRATGSASSAELRSSDW
jgi:hypothetical protein